MTAFKHAAQLVESSATSLNQIAATFKNIQFPTGTLNLDYGGGKYDKASELLAERGALNVVYDPYNRSKGHNLSVRIAIGRRGGADSATINNVLNVIAEESAQREVIEQAANGLKPEGKAYFLIHEGDRNGAGKQTTKGWQRNEKAAAYMDLISASFGSVARKGNMIVASEPTHTPRSLFDIDAISTELRETSKKLGIPQPSAKHGAGKLIGGCLYLHKSAWNALPEEQLCAAIARLPEDFVPAIAKWDISDGAFSFIESQAFDTEHEPAIQRAAKVKADGSLKITAEKADPQIYHHKWNFVRPDYQGFDVLESMARSIAWADAPCERSKIGTRSYWDREVVWPALGGVGAANPKPAPQKTIKSKKSPDA